jgi:hypothetical protein
MNKKDWLITVWISVTDHVSFRTQQWLPITGDANIAAAI